MSSMDARNSILSIPGVQDGSLSLTDAVTGMSPVTGDTFAAFRTGFGVDVYRGQAGGRLTRRASTYRGSMSPEDQLHTIVEQRADEGCVDLSGSQMPSRAWTVNEPAFRGGKKGMKKGVCRYGRRKPSKKQSAAGKKGSSHSKKSFQSKMMSSKKKQ